jgi:hypothetical protein
VLALKLAQAKGLSPTERVEQIWNELSTIPDLVEVILDDMKDLEAHA